MADDIRVINEIEYNKNPDGSWRSPEEVFADLVSQGRLDERMKTILAENFILQNLATDEEIIEATNSGRNPYGQVYTSFGRWIRNSYGFWHPKNQHTDHDAGSDSLRHPDNLSAHIIERLHAHFKAELKG